MQTALSLINQAYEEGWEELDLSGMELTELPPEIGKLVQLKRLILGKDDRDQRKRYGNSLTDLPKEIQQLQQLEELSLPYNKFIVIPESVTQLPNLKFLDLNDNEVNSIPDSIAQLVNLEKLYLDDHQLSVLPESIFQLLNLQCLSFNNSQLSNFPEFISNLGNLRELSLQRNELTTIPDWIIESTKLEVLDLGKNQIAKIPNSITRLTNLTKLRLSNNPLGRIPDSITQLVSLKKLSLSKSQISEIPDSIGQLINLDWLSFVQNQVSVIPNSVSNLRNLKELIIWENEITSIPESIGNLVNLETLSIGRNQINRIPDSIGGLINLKKLYLSKNNIIRIPDSIASLSSLVALNLGNNAIEELPQTLMKLENLEILRLFGNPLSIPTETLRQGWGEKIDDPGNPRAVLDYYFTTRDPNQAQDLYEAKLILVGEGGSGKTSLANKLINPDYDLKPETEDTSTEGIDILKWEFTGTNGKDYKIHIWDFGGQEIYHQTHQFFLTDRSLYLLVADSRKEDTDHPYWLNIIRLLSNHSPTLLVQNQRADRPCNLNLRDLRAEFGDFLTVPNALNITHPNDLNTLRHTIQRHLETLIGPGLPFPNKWLNVRHTLENDSRNHISLHDYQTTCRRHDITDQSEMLQLSQFLHNLGTCLHFQNDPILRQTLILKPNWGTAAVYKVLDNDRINQNLGQFDRTDLANIWSEPDYKNLHHELLQLMMEFKVCYEIPRRPGHYIAPHLLTTDSPTYPWPSDHLLLRYHYKTFMPKGLLTRFIVEQHRLIENVSCPDQALVWKTGVVLTHGTTRAEILENQQHRTIEIRVTGPRPRDFLTILNHQFEDIHDRYESLDYATLIPCNCTICKPTTTPFTFALDRLHTCLNRGRYTIECHESGEDVQVRGLIDGVINEYPDDFEDSPEEFSGTRDGRSVTHRRSRSPTPLPTPIINIYNTNQQDQDMSNDKTWNGDRVETKLEGKYINNQSPNSIVGEQTIQGDNIQGNKIVNAQNLTQAAQEIKILLDQISATDTTKNPTLIALKAIEAIENNPTLKQRIINAGKEAGFAAIDAAVEHPAIKIVTAAIKGAIDA